MRAGEGYDGPDCNITEFYAVVRASYSSEDIRALIEKSNLAIRVAKIRGLIPWDYDGEREYEVGRLEFDWPDPPPLGEEAA